MTKNTLALLLFCSLLLTINIAFSQANCNTKKISGATNYYGNQITTICNYDSGYTLQNYSRNIYVWNDTSNTSACKTNLNVFYNNEDGFFRTDTLAFTAYWVAQQCYQYLKDSLNWQGLNGNNDSIQIVISNINDFGFCPEQEVVFIGKNINVTVDIIAHEIFHGIINSTANFEGDLEPAALEEAACDIFGELIENYATGNNDWIFDPLTNDVNKKRSFTNPTIYGDAKKYRGSNWDYGFGKMYNNNGVINHWFYLLSEQIGIFNAFKILFKALTEGLCRTANFSDARYATIQAAKEIYGNNSQVVQYVKSSWNSVGVFEVDIIKASSNIFQITDSEDHFNYTNIVTYETINTKNVTNKTVNITIGNTALLNKGITIDQTTNFSIEIENCSETIKF